MKTGRHRPRGGRGTMMGLIALAALALAVGLVAALLWTFTAPALWPAAVAGAIALAALALAVLTLRLIRLYDGVDRLRGDLIQLSQGHLAVGRGAGAVGLDPDIAGTTDLVADLSDLIADRDKRVARRLESVLAGIASAIVVATESGQVTLVNGAARRLLGAEHVAVGTSLYAALVAEPAIAAAHRARDEGIAVHSDLALTDGRTLPARIIDLRGDGGALFSFAITADHDANDEIEHALDLHDVAPTLVDFDDATPLAELPVFALDLETTGLNVENDAIVAIGGISARGTRLYQGSALDMLVNPNRPIPARSTRIHGITDAMVAAAPPFSEAWPVLAKMIEGRVVVGHHIGFDRAVLRATTRRDGLDWAGPLTLDTAQLAMALDPRGGEPSLEVLARRYGAEIVGRHTALGDALTAAAIWQRLLPRLADRDVTTLGAARAFADTAHALLKKQIHAGWHNAEED